MHILLNRKGASVVGFAPREATTVPHASPLHPAAVLCSRGATVASSKRAQRARARRRRRRSPPRPATTIASARLRRCLAQRKAACVADAGRGAARGALGKESVRASTSSPRRPRPRWRGLRVRAQRAWCSCGAATSTGRAGRAEWTSTSSCACRAGALRPPSRRGRVRHAIAPKHSALCTPASFTTSALILCAHRESCRR